MKLSIEEITGIRDLVIQTCNNMYKHSELQFESTQMPVISDKDELTDTSNEEVLSLIRMKRDAKGSSDSKKMGIVAIALDREYSAILTKRFKKGNSEITETDMLDSIGEMTNVIAGNMMNVVEGFKKLDLPLTILTSDKKNSEKYDEIINIIENVSRHQGLCIFLQVQSPDIKLRLYIFADFEVE